MTGEGKGTGEGLAPPVVAPRRPRPSPEELAAVVAAVELAWPRRPAASGPPVVRPQPDLGGWRWSGRWWAPGRQVAARRRRPGR